MYYRLYHSYLELGSGIFVPEAVLAIRSHSGQSPMDRVEGNVIYLEGEREGREGGRGGGREEGREGGREGGRERERDEKPYFLSDCASQVALS